jgi:hypothetical protein
VIGYVPGSLKMNVLEIPGGLEVLEVLEVLEDPEKPLYIVC